MSDDISEQEASSEQRLKDAFGDKPQAIAAELREIDTGEWKRTKDTVVHVADALPGSTLVGGIAPRLHLESRGHSIPHMPMIDVDVSLDHERYDQVRSEMPVIGDDQFQSSSEKLSAEEAQKLKDAFMRKGDETADGSDEAHNFVSHPEENLALEDIKTRMHVDVFPEDLEDADITPLNIDGQIVMAKSPEELFIARVQQIAQILRKESDGPVELPWKIHQYFYLNGGIVDEDRLVKLAKKKGFDGDAIEFVELMHKQLTDGIESGSIVLIDKYH